MMQYFCMVSKVHIGKPTWWLPSFHPTWWKYVEFVKSTRQKQLFFFYCITCHLGKGLVGLSCLWIGPIHASTTAIVHVYLLEFAWVK